MILILDLDDTIYETATIGNDIFSTGLSEINIEERKIYDILQDFGKLSTFDIFRKHKISREQIDLFYKALVNQKSKLTIKPFDDYRFIKSINCDKYLVTTGFRDWQLAKIDHLGIAYDFKKIMVHIPGSKHNKAYYFKEIQRQTGLAFSDHYVIGDNPQNELHHAYSLGMKTIQRRTPKQLNFPNADYLINEFSELSQILGRRSHISI